MAYSETARANMLTNQLEPNGAHDVRVLAAFSSVPRELFVENALQQSAYLDDALPLGHNRFLMEPRLHAKILQAAQVQPDDKMLDIACGSGYSAAILSKLSHSVVALESVGELAEIARRNLRELKCTAELFCASLAGGYNLKAPYDVIIINGAVEMIPDELHAQLAEGGRIYAVLMPAQSDAPGYKGIGQATCWTKQASELYPKTLFEAAGRLLAPFTKKPHFTF